MYNNLSPANAYPTCPCSHAAGATGNTAASYDTLNTSRLIHPHFRRYEQDEYVRAFRDAPCQMCTRRCHRFTVQYTCSNSVRLTSLTLAYAPTRRPIQDLSIYVGFSSRDLTRPILLIYFSFLGVQVRAPSCTTSLAPVNIAISASCVVRTWKLSRPGPFYFECTSLSARCFFF